MDAYAILEYLAEGSYGKVYRAVHRRTGLEVAIKVIDYSALEKRRLNYMIQREVRAISRLNTLRAVVHFYSWFPVHNTKHFVLTMEYAGLGDLSTLVKCYGALPEAWCRFFLAEIVVGLEGLTSARYAHRDIKPQNILLTRDGHVKISDFGTIKDLTEEEVEMAEGRTDFVARPLGVAVDRKPKQDSHERASVYGTAVYLAPEANLAGLIYETPLDVWSLGCIMYELLTGKPAFMGNNELNIFFSTANTQTPIPTDASRAAQDLVSKLLTKDPCRRFAGGWPAIKRHPFFHGVNFELITEQKPPFEPKVIYSDLSDYNAVGGSNWERRRPDRATRADFNTAPTTDYGFLQRFLMPSERVLFTTDVIKRRALRVDRRRRFVLTDFPRLFYIDPETMVQKGSVDLTSASLRVTRVEQRVLEFSQKTNCFSVEVSTQDICDKFLNLLTKIISTSGADSATAELICDQCGAKLLKSGFCNACGNVAQGEYKGPSTIQYIMQLDPRWLPTAEKKAFFNDYLALKSDVQPELDNVYAVTRFRVQESLQRAAERFRRQSSDVVVTRLSHHRRNSRLPTSSPTSSAYSQLDDSKVQVSAAPEHDFFEFFQQNDPPGEGDGLGSLDASIGRDDLKTFDPAGLPVDTPNVLPEGSADLRCLLAKVYAVSVASENIKYPTLPLPRILVLGSDHLITKYEENFPYTTCLLATLRLSTMRFLRMPPISDMTASTLLSTCLCTCTAKRRDRLSRTIGQTYDLMTDHTAACYSCGGDVYKTARNEPININLESRLPRVRVPMVVCPEGVLCAAKMMMSSSSAQHSPASAPAPGYPDLRPQNVTDEEISAVAYPDAGLRSSGHQHEPLSHSCSANVSFDEAVHESQSYRSRTSWGVEMIASYYHRLDAGLVPERLREELYFPEERKAACALQTIQHTPGVIGAPRRCDLQELNFIRDQTVWESKSWYAYLNSTGYCPNITHENFLTSKFKDIQHILQRCSCTQKVSLDVTIKYVSDESYQSYQARRGELGSISSTDRSTSTSSDENQQVHTSSTTQEPPLNRHEPPNRQLFSQYCPQCHCPTCLARADKDAVLPSALLSRDVFFDSEFGMDAYSLFLFHHWASRSYGTVYAEPGFPVRRTCVQCERFMDSHGPCVNVSTWVHLRTRPPARRAPPMADAALPVEAEFW